MEEDPKISFQKAGYKLIRQLIDPDTLSSIFTHLIEQGKGQRHTGFYKGVFFYKHPIFEQLLVSMLPTIEEHTAYSLYKTYSFARQYLMGDELKPHTDRNACEITVSISLSVENNC